MALTRRNPKDLPSDAIKLSESEAFIFHNKIIECWDNWSDVFAIKYGVYFLSGANLFTGMYINNYFRTKFKVGSYGRISSYLPVCVVPSIMSLLLHSELVTNELYLLKQNTCPVCIEMRAAAIQSLSGTILPLLIAPAAAISIVHRYATYNMPYITKEPAKAFNTILKVTSPLKNILFAIFVGQALLASAVTYFEFESVYTVQKKLARLEDNLEAVGVIR